MERRPYGAPGGEHLVDQLPNLGREKEMLAAMGMTSMDELFSDIPEHVRRDTPLDLPDPQSEEEILRVAQMLLDMNIPINSRPSFLGAGLYSNYVPTMVPMLATRGEFLTDTHPISQKSAKVCFRRCGNSRRWYRNWWDSQYRTFPCMTPVHPPLRH